MPLALTPFLFATIALLAAPGPSNTLVGIAGAQGGLRRVALLLPALGLGYLCAVLPIAWAGAMLVKTWPAIMPTIRLVAAAWVLWLAIGLWRDGASGTRAPVISAGKLWLTTLLNPKALVVALALLPMPGDPRFTSRLALFAATSVIVAILWGGIGAASATRDNGSRLATFQRLAAVWLLSVSAWLALTAIRM